MGKRLSGWWFTVNAVRVNLTDAKKVTRLSVKVETLKGRCDAYESTMKSLVESHKEWKEQCEAYRLFLVGVIIQFGVGGNFIRLRKHFVDPKFRYEIRVDEDDDSVRLKVAELRKVQYVESDAGKDTGNQMPKHIDAEATDQVPEMPKGV